MAFNANDPLGWDFSCVDDVDQDLAPVSGRLCVAQAVARRWITNRGELFYDPEYGAGLRNYISGNTQNIGTLAGRLEDEARKDERVDDCKCSVDVVGETLTVRGVLVAASGPFALVLSLSQTTLTLETLDA